jgi:hypothetical protein
MARDQHGRDDEHPQRPGRPAEDPDDRLERPAEGEGQPLPRPVDEDTDGQRDEQLGDDRDRHEQGRDRHARPEVAGDEGQQRAHRTSADGADQAGPVGRQHDRSPPEGDLPVGGHAR